MTDHARAALEHLRDPSQFRWYVIPLLLLVLHVYAVEVERRNWNAVLAGLALWGMDWFNEIWNALVLHATGRAPVWGATGPTAYQILVGLNIEICLMFAVMGVVAVKLLPADPALRIAGIPNRWLFAGVNSALAVGIEIFLHRAGVLTWDWPWWQASCPVLIWLLGYLPFFLVAFHVHDQPRIRTKVRTVATILAVDAAALTVFGTLGWL
ncbi:hypothetical protein [Kitasatospora sp. NPDC094015]|uniref:hypothetical protein n=1 Tax=Kitasatospora sp. NPDC094015 TaxID=3155205 RepID=UPI0033293F8C